MQPDERSIIDVTIEQTEAGLRFVATTPHVPNLRGESNHEHEAINLLIAALRAHAAAYAERGRPAPWVEVDVSARAGRDVHRRRITGLRPAQTEPIEPHQDAAQPAANPPPPRRSKRAAGAAGA